MARLIDDFEAVFLDDRIGEDFFGDLFELFLCFVVRPAIEIEDEEFALAYVGNSGIAKTRKGMVNGLTLRIEYGAFGHDPDMSFHKKSIAGGVKSCRVREPKRGDCHRVTKCTAVGGRMTTC